jgi:hypothetical protein
MRPSARWKIENESFNTLKTNGYNLEHNFGHGQHHLSAVLAILNLTAFALHTVAELLVALWRNALHHIGARTRFFAHLRAITPTSSSPHGNTSWKPSPAKSHNHSPLAKCQNGNCWSRLGLLDDCVDLGVSA